MITAGEGKGGGVDEPEEGDSKKLQPFHLFPLCDNSRIDPPPVFPEIIILLACGQMTTQSKQWTSFYPVYGVYERCTLG
jgi:hypothetical protein